MFILCLSMRFSKPCVKSKNNKLICAFSDRKKFLQKKSETKFWFGGLMCENNSTKNP